MQDTMGLMVVVECGFVWSLVLLSFDYRTLYTILGTVNFSNLEEVCLAAFT